MKCKPEPRWVRYHATIILQRMASNAGVTAVEAAKSMHGERPIGPKCRQVAFALAALYASLEAGNWQEQRAEAECKVREGWRP